MATLVLVRHGRTTANASGVLAGWTEGVELDETGREQASSVGARLAGTGVVAVATSPLLRCRQTAERLAPGGVDVLVEEGLGECRYGAWTGRSLTDLAKDPLWKDVQARPSQVTFPPHPEHEHESMTAMQERAVSAVRAVDARVDREHGSGAVWVAVSHGDVIKAILADALGVALDDFQRLIVDPASISIVRYAADRPFLLRSNDTSTAPVDLPAPKEEAEVGGGAGSA